MTETYLKALQVPLAVIVSWSMLFLASSFFSLLYHSPRIILGMLQLKSEKFSVDHELNSWASPTPNSPEEQIMQF